MGLISEITCGWCDLEDEIVEHKNLACPALSVKRLGAFGASFIDVDTVRRQLFYVKVYLTDKSSLFFRISFSRNKSNCT